jgi:glycosyltransferase involved in cell wall biosynthesis
VVVLPYLEATQSGVAQIAMSFEKPMIGTTVGGMPDAIKDDVTGLLVPPGDSAALSAALIRYFDEQLAQPFSVNMRVDKETASWLPLVQLIEELAAPSTAPAPMPAATVGSPRVL